MPCGYSSSGGITTQQPIATLTPQSGCGGEVTESNHGDQSYSIDFRECRGVCTPHFHERKRRGELLPYTPWYQFEVSGGVTGGSYETSWDDPNVPCDASTTVINPFVPYDDLWIITSGEIENVLSNYDFHNEVMRAAAAMYSKGHDTLTFLAELHKTRDMFSGVARKMYRAYRRGKPRKEDFDVAGAWLGVRYGVRPLIYDIIDIEKAINMLDEEKKRTRFTQRAGSSYSYTEEEVIPGRWSGGDQETSIVTTYNISVRGSITADFKPNAFSFNLLRTGWELVPYSFVVDWMIDIGTYLEAMSFLTLQTAHTAAGGFKVEASKQYRRYSTSTESHYGGSFTVSASTDAEYVRRVPTSVGLHPKLNFRFDDLKGIDLLFLIKKGFKL